MYAWGPYVAMPHFAQTQREAGAFHPAVDELRAGDLVFFEGYLTGGIGHVAIYEGDGTVIEAPQSGGVVQRAPLRRLMAEGGYRGAVRPLTPQTPGFTDGARVSTRGGTVTLRGERLAEVTSLSVGERTVTRFLRHSDTAITFRVAGGKAGSVPVLARTPWGAVTDPVRLTYVRPAVTAAPRTTPPASPAPPRVTPPKTPPSTAPTSGPAGPSGGPTRPVPTTPPAATAVPTTPAPSPTTSTASVSP